MSRARTFTLWALAALVGGGCWRLFDQQRTGEIVVVVWMALMVLWFNYEDWFGDSYRP